jgi:5-methylcytosine-specific restriction enzyme subunit McrC
MSAMLPVMQTDIMLTYEEKTLIIDAKYYTHSMQVHYDNHTLHSVNLYQIFTYVKNKEVELADRPHEVSGMLLYARTDEEIYPENEYSMSGNRIEFRTLNLDGDFAMIKAHLDGIAEKYFGIQAA